MKSRMSVDPGGDIAAVEFRHDEIEKDEIGFAFQGRLKGSSGIVFLKDPELRLLFQPQFQKAKKAWFIVQDEDSLFSHSGGFSSELIYFRRSEMTRQFPARRAAISGSFFASLASFARVSFAQRHFSEGLAQRTQRF